MSIQFSLHQKIVHHVICKASDVISPGLLNGSMGVCITLYCISERDRSKAIKTFADHLLVTCIENISIDTSIGFSNGLCGIAWGIDFMLQRNYITGDSKKICEDIDRRISQICPQRLDCNLESGLKGVLHYLLAHSYHNSRYSNSFNHDFLSEVYTLTCKMVTTACDEDMEYLCKNYIDWYNYEKCDYTFCLNRFIKSDWKEITEENYQSYPIQLTSGLCGYLINESNESDGLTYSI